MEKKTAYCFMLCLYYYSLDGDSNNDLSSIICRENSPKNKNQYTLNYFLFIYSGVKLIKLKEQFTSMSLLSVQFPRWCIMRGEKINISGEYFIFGLTNTTFTNVQCVGACFCVYFRF
jgi:hypothetical protein